MSRRPQSRNSHGAFFQLHRLPRKGKDEDPRIPSFVSSVAYDDEYGLRAVVVLVLGNAFHLSHVVCARDNNIGRVMMPFPYVVLPTWFRPQLRQEPLQPGDSPVEPSTPRSGVHGRRGGGGENCRRTVRRVVADENSSRFPSSRYRTETTDLVFDFPREDHLKPSVVGRIGSRGRTHDAPPVSAPFVRS